MNKNTKYWIGMAVSVAIAAGASADFFPDGQLKHWLQALGVIGTALNGYLIQHQNDDPFVVKGGR